MNTVEQLKSLQPQQSMGEKLSKTVSDVSQLTSKMNEISAFLSEASIESGNKPFDLKTFARELVLKQNKSDAQNNNNNEDVTNNKPLTKKLKQQTKKVLTPLVKYLLQSDRLLKLLETQVNKVLSTAKVNQVRVEGGQIQAQPITTPELNKAINNINQITTTYIKSVDKYALRVYNTKPITTTKELQQNLSLKHMVDFIQTVLSIYLLLLKVQIKIRKAKDAGAAINAMLTVPPQPLVAERFTQLALENTAAEQKKLDDLESSYAWISEVKEKIAFYGSKYEIQSNKLRNIQQVLDQFQQSSIQKISNTLNMTGSVEKTK
jgi:hypothetical protein